jgi:hypothetical protein
MPYGRIIMGVRVARSMNGVGDHCCMLLLLQLVQLLLLLLHAVLAAASEGMGFVMMVAPAGVGSWAGCVATSSTITWGRHGI